MIANKSKGLTHKMANDIGNYWRKAIVSTSVKLYCQK